MLWDTNVRGKTTAATRHCAGALPDQPDQNLSTSTEYIRYVVVCIPFGVQVGRAVYELLERGQVEDTRLGRLRGPSRTLGG